MPFFQEPPPDVRAIKDREARPRHAADDGSDAAAAACNALGGILPDDVFKAQIAFDDGSGSAITKMSASWQRAQSELVVAVELTYLDQDMILCMLPALGDARVVLERRRDSESE